MIHPDHRNTTRHRSGPTFALAVTLLVALTASATHAQTIPALPKTGKTVTPPLSTRLPDAVTTLPNFGTITWETTHLPWVGEGPYDGISGIGMVEIDGLIYVVGGFNPGGDGSDDISHRTSRWTRRYDPTSGEWTALADAPFRREYARAMVAEGKLYLAGGGCIRKDEEPPYQAYAECMVFDPADGPKGTWTTVAPLTVPRTHMAVGYAAGHLLVAGGNQYDFAEKGYSHQTIRGTLDVLDPAKPDRGWQQKSPIPGAARGWCASLVADDALYVFGGITWNPDNTIAPTAETLRYDVTADTWTSLTPPPLPISGWEGALYDDRYALNVGGVVRPQPDSSEDLIWSDNVLAYDLHEDTWLQVGGALPPGGVFNDPGVVIIGDTIYVLGAEGPHGSHYNYFLIGEIAKK